MPTSRSLRQLRPHRRQRHGDRAFGEPTEQRGIERAQVDDVGIHARTRRVAGEASQPFKKAAVTAGCGSADLSSRRNRGDDRWPSASTNSCAGATISACSCMTTRAARPCSSTRPRRRRSWRRSSAPAGSRTLMLITHHHGDHVEANLALKKKFGLTIIGPKARRRRSPASTSPSGRRCDPVRPRDDLGVSRRPATRPAISPTSFPNSHVLFAADTLFALGCGRLLECKPPVMFESLQEARGAAARNQGLLRPRIHAGQCPLRADRRSRPIRR